LLEFDFPKDTTTAKPEAEHLCQPFEKVKLMPPNAES
jgi:hypothetical protein